MLNPQLTSLIITPEGLANLKALLDELQQDTNAKSIILVEKSGQHLTNVGEDSPHLMSLAALVAGAFASTGAIAQLIGEPEFRTMFQQGQQASLFISLLDTQDLLTVIFDERTTIGMIKLKTLQMNKRISEAMHKMAEAGAKVRVQGALSSLQSNELTSTLD